MINTDFSKLGTYDKDCDLVDFCDSICDGIYGSCKAGASIGAPRCDAGKKAQLILLNKISEQLERLLNTNE
ncbi:hypothetical protein [Clostridioides sp. ZZV15-6597]|uniref:hypothetical protein n=1 Tax=Clostridioides sp. ZZV15-6597 TaxID=2811500 RepID=UPI001D1226C1|nr:hypothetical protein [Clostridioides sp. ZZV15-6597]